MCDFVCVDSLVDLVTSKSDTEKDINLPYIGLEHIESGTGKIIGFGKTGDSKSTNGVFLRNDILFGKLRPRLKKCGLALENGYCSTDILILRAKEHIHPGFAYRILSSESVFSHAISSEEGTKMPRTSWRKLAGAIVWCPEIVEQRTISIILDTVDVAIQRSEALIEKLRQMKAGMLSELLTKGLDENGKFRDPVRHPAQFKDSPLGKIPKDWEINTIGSLIKELDAGVSVNAWDRPAGVGEIGVLKTSCVSDGKFKSEQNKTVLPRDQARVSSPVKADSIIISRMNTPLLVGESGYVDENHPGLFLPDRLWQTIMREERCVSVKWLSFVLNWHPVRKLIRDTATGTSGSMKNISKGVFLSIEIRIPQIEEQELIANRVGEFDKVLDNESKFLSKLHQLKQGLMQDLLTSRVRVPTSLKNKYQKELEKN